MKKIPIIIAQVEKYFSLPPGSIVAKNRTPEIAVPRMIVYYLASKIPKKTTTDIGREVGGRDHSTVISGREKIREMIETDLELSASVEELRKICAREIMRRTPLHIPWRELTPEDRPEDGDMVIVKCNDGILFVGKVHHDYGYLVVDNNVSYSKEFNITHFCVVAP